MAETNGSQMVYPHLAGSMSGETMTDQLDGKTIVRLFVRTLLLTWFAVVGLTISLCSTPSCGCRIACALIGMVSGSILFIQISCAQIERHYRGGFGSRISSLNA